MIASGVGWVHLGLALIVTLTLAGGIFGLGGLVAGTGGIGSRWIRGWTGVWWTVALSAQFFGPRVGVSCGAAAATTGVVWLMRHPGSHVRTAFAASTALLVGAPLWMAPPQFYDTLVYHLGLPWSWLVNGSFAPVDHNLFSHFPLAASTVYLLPVAAGVPEAAAGLHWLSFGIALNATLKLSRNLGAGRWSWMGALLLFGTWHAPWLASLAGADVFVLLGVIVAAERLTSASDPADVPWVDVGMALGLALASKYTAAVPVAALLLAAWMFQRPRWKIFGAGAISIVASSFWWVRNALTVGNPFHPLLWTWFRGGGWTAEDYARYAGLVREGVAGAGSWMMGVIHLGTPSQLGVWFGMAAVVALAGVCARDSESKRARTIGAAALLTLVAWTVTAQTGRYALPAAALIAALAASGLARLRPRYAKLAAAALGCAAVHGVIVWGLFVFGSLGLQRSWLGSASREEWRHAVTVNDPTPAYRAADTLLPANSRVLIVGEGRPFGCPRPHHASSPYDAQWLQSVVQESPSAAAVSRAVAAAGWTHLLINWAEVNRLGGDDFRVLRWRSQEEFERYKEFGIRHTERVWADGALEIRVVRSEDPPDGAP
jgi:hypothetical protein